MTESETLCGYVAIVGRPNVGKSTLLNHLLGTKLSITSRKPQTTRHNALGILTEDNCQIIFVDTPGIHGGQDKALNRYMNKSASTAIRDVDVVVFVVDRDKWTDADEAVAQRLNNIDHPLLIVINKLDRIENRERLGIHMGDLAEKFPHAEIIPVSALNGRNLKELKSAIVRHMPENPFFYPEDQLTDKTDRFLVAEIVREKITRQLGAELPYEATVEIEQWEQQGKILHISALILVEREGQKKIIIGDKGARLKKIGQQARLDMEKLLGNKIMLKLWVKVKAGWSDDERALKSLGYHDIQ
jgi:GTP-binding protein Era